MLHSYVFNRIFTFGIQTNFCPCSINSSIATTFHKNFQKTFRTNFLLHSSYKFSRQTLPTIFPVTLFKWLFEITFHITFHKDTVKKGKKYYFSKTHLGTTFREDTMKNREKQRKINKRKGKRERWEHWTKDVLHERLANRGGPGPGARAVFRRSVQVHTSVRMVAQEGRVELGLFQIPT